MASETTNTGANNALLTDNQRILIDLVDKSSPPLTTSFFSKSPEPLCILDIHNCISWVNPAFQKTFADEKTPLITKPIIELIYAEDRKAALETLLPLKTGSTISNAIHRFTTNTKNYRWFVWTAIPALEQGITLFYTHDITEQKQQQQLNQVAVEATRDGIVIADATKDGMPIIYASPTFLSLTGYSMEEIINKNCRFLQGPETDPETVRKLSKAITAKEIHVCEILNYRKNGQAFWNLLRISPIFDAMATLTHFVGSQTDITALKQAQETTTQFGQILEASLSEIYITDLETLQFVQVNQGASRNLGYNLTELHNLNYLDIQRDFSKSDFLHKLASLRGREKTIISYDSRNYRKDQSTYPVEVTLQLATITNTNVLIAVMMDITEQKQTQEILRTQAEVFANLYDGVIITDLTGAITDWNKSAERMFGFTREEAIGKTADELPELAAALKYSNDNLAGNNSENYQRSRLVYTRRDGQQRTCETSISGLKNENGETTGMLRVYRDITEEHNLAKQLLHQASHDSLTNLINRRQFEKHLQTLLESARLYRAEHALCYLDLDQFKIINDTSGHIAGDELLRQLSGLLRSKIRRQDILARLGGDEFGVLIQQCSVSHAKRIAKTICSAVSDFRFQWEDKCYNIGVSIGLVPINEKSGTISDLLSWADSACYAAKDEGRNRIHVYHVQDAKIEQHLGEMQWATRLKSALQENQFELFSQPIVYACGNNNHQHHELLLRMRDKQGGLITPEAFLPAAERYALSTELDRWVMQYAFDWLEQQPSTASDKGMYFINLSGQSLSNEWFLNELVATVTKSQFPAERICFEITETAAIVNLTHAVHFIKTLRQLNCRFALDDFGSGFSSFAYLKNLQVDFIKIDGFFIKGISQDPVSHAMVRSINDIGHVMGKETIAECVEDAAVAEQLREMGVNYLQGFALGKPSPLKK